MAGTDTKPLAARYPKSKRGQARFHYLYNNGIAELIEAFEGRQLSLSTAEIVAHLPANEQPKEIARLVAGKEKVIVLGATEALLLRQRREEQMKAVENDGLNEFQQEFRRYWLRLRRKYHMNSEGEMWRWAETVIIRLTAPEIKESVS